MPPSSPDRPTSPIDGFDPRYQLRELPIGGGGMGQVWEGHDTRLDRRVAVKFVRFPDGAPDNELIRRFTRESRITARLQHPGVPAVYDSGVHQKHPYLVMERVDGVSLGDLIAETEQLPVEWAASITAQTCAVLGAAHTASLVHRDLKPDNLILEPQGTVKVLDFGLATAEGVPELSRITHTGQTLGTPAYMAPEQIQDGTSSVHTDLYALGCTLFEMLTGRRPFTGTTSYSVMIKHVSEPSTPVRQIRPRVPPGLAEVVAALLEKQPTNRPADAFEVYRRVVRFVTDLPPLPGVLTPPDRPSPVRMYATAVSRFTGGPEPGTPAGGQPGLPGPAAPTPPTAGPGPVSGAGSGRAYLAEARSRASALKNEARYSQAGAVLGNAVAEARRSGDGLGPEVVELWWEWATVLFEGGDYHSAAPAFESLAAVLAETGGADVDLMFRCRRQHASCVALAGENERALDLMYRLLADEQRALGPADDRPLELRRQIGMLLQRMGAPQAEQVLRDLLRDLVQLRGPDHPSVRQLHALLGRPHGG